MRKYIPYFILGLFINLNVSAAYITPAIDTLINDGPYIYFADNGFKVNWIENGVFREHNLSPENFNEIKKKFKLLFNYDDLKSASLPEPEYKQSYSNADSIGIISDIHGEFPTYIKLLQASGIIDKTLNWKFGRGHLVVIGDIFDRGDMVTEVLWHLFGLEKQAVKAGGMVHVLLGNHEFLILRKELSYINEKYEKAELISNIRYYDQFSDNSVLGKWLRSKPVMITIDNIIFVHAGISAEMIHRNLNVEQVNRIFSENILGKDLKLVNCDEELYFLDEYNGPLWYRGYFADTTFCESRLDSILDFYGKEHIVVGHTVHKQINSLFNTKILGADTGIMYKQSPEMIIYKNGSFYINQITGKRIKL
jgi:hypothetical protein